MHPWFDSRGPVSWRRDQEEPPEFIGTVGDAGLVVPMRPKRQNLGAVI